MDIVVQFAKLWRMETVDSRNDKEKYTNMEAYNSEELLDLLCSWKDEYLANEDADDAYEYFYKKIKQSSKSRELSLLFLIKYNLFTFLC